MGKLTFGTEVFTGSFSKGQKQGPGVLVTSNG